MKKAVIVLTTFFLATLLGGCAFDVISIKQTPTKLNSEIACNDSFVLASNVDLPLVGGYSRTLKQGTRWFCVGSIEHGNVFRTRDQVLTIEASNVYEAYLVVSSMKLVGFYLPVEHGYSPLDKPIELVLDRFPQTEGTKH